MNDGIEGNVILHLFLLVSTHSHHSACALNDKQFSHVMVDVERNLFYFTDIYVLCTEIECRIVKCTM